jgi:hypothetical protein
MRPAGGKSSRPVSGQHQSKERNVRGEAFGVVPYDFERPSLAKIRDRMWNPASDRIFMPKAFGIGWDLNLAALKRRYPLLFWLLVGLVALRVLRLLRRLRA